MKLLLPVLIVFCLVIGCKGKGVMYIKSDCNDLNKVVFVNGWYKGFLAAQQLYKKGEFSKDEIFLKAFKDSVNFATYINSK